MLKKWLKENKTSTSFSGSFLLFLFMVYVVYTLFGHKIIVAMYEGKSILFLNSLVSKAWRSMDQYFNISDGLFFCYVKGFALAGLFFGVFLLKRFSQKSLSLKQDVVFAMKYCRREPVDGCVPESSQV